MSLDNLSLVFSTVIGFAMAGLLATGFHLVAARPASFRMMRHGGYYPFFAILFLAFAAPMIIARNTMRGMRLENRRMEFVFAAAIIACIWSMMSGRVILKLFGFMN